MALIFFLFLDSSKTFLNIRSSYRLPMETVTRERLEKYLSVTKVALGEAKRSPENIDITDHSRISFLDTVERYINDAEHFVKQGDFVTAFAALNYAHGWLDAGVKLGIFDVDNEELFAGVG